MISESIEKKILRCLQENYGLDGNLDRLAGENLNYLLTTNEGVHHVVKVVGDDMPAEVVEMEFAAIEHAISAEFALLLPKITTNKFGKLETGIYIHNNELNRLRLLKYIDNTVLKNATDISDILIKNVGMTIAAYHSAMKNFDHPAAHRNHRWNLAEVGQHRGKERQLGDPEKAALMAWGFDRWEGARGLLDSLPWQFIHGDLNPENIMVEGQRVTGLIDFGDACFNPAVCDLAICLAYMMMDQPDPLTTMALIVDGYREVGSLNELEDSVLLPLVCGRLVNSIAVSTERRIIDPGNPNWFGSEGSAWTLLETLSRFR